jgi:hypothetical protein
VLPSSIHVLPNAIVTMVTVGCVLIGSTCALSAAHVDLLELRGAVALRLTLGAKTRQLPFGVKGDH